MLALAVLASSVVEVHIAAAAAVAVADAAHPLFVEVGGFVPAAGLDELDWKGLLELMSLEPVVNPNF